MIGDQQRAGPHGRRTIGTVAAAVLSAAALVVAVSAWAQVPQPAASPQAANPPATTPPAESSPAETPPSPPAATPAPKPFEPGFLDAVRRWMEGGREKFSSDMKEAKRRIEEFHERAAKDAESKFGKPPGGRVVTGRERCPPAANGAPDCRAAANTVCKAKGYTSGQSIDTSTAQKCPARIWLSGRAPRPGECADETYVTRAACQ